MLYRIVHNDNGIIELLLQGTILKVCQYLTLAALLNDSECLVFIAHL